MLLNSMLLQQEKTNIRRFVCREAPRAEEKQSVMDEDQKFTKRSQNFMNSILWLRVASIDRKQPDGKARAALR